MKKPADRAWEDVEAELLAGSAELRRAMEETEPAAQVAMELLRVRREQGLSQREVAERMWTTQSVISRIERMDTTPSLTTVHALANALGRRLDIRFLAPDEQPSHSANPLESLRRDLQHAQDRIRLFLQDPAIGRLVEAVQEHSRRAIDAVGRAPGRGAKTGKT